MALGKVVAVLLVAAGLTAIAQTPPQQNKPATPAPAQQPTPPPAPPPPPQKRESAIAWLLRIAGITATTARQKGGENDAPGVIWVMDLVAEESSPLPLGNNFRWPIFLTGNRGILALRNKEVVLLGLDGKKQRTVATVPNIVKLVASGVDNPDEVLVVVQDGKASKLGTLSLLWGEVSVPEFEATVIPNTDGLTDEQLAVDVATGDVREFGVLKVYVETMKDKNSNRFYTDVMLVVDKSGPNDPSRNISNCNGANCSQPSISSEGRYVAFIKTPRQ